MKRQNLGARRIFALLFSGVMIFASVDAEVLAAETSRTEWMTETVNDINSNIGINEADSSEISSETAGESGETDGTDITGADAGESSANDSEADNKDAIEESGTEDGETVTGESGETDGADTTGADAEESGETGGADTTEETESADAEESIGDAVVSENDADENEAVPDIEMQQSRETLLSDYGELFSEKKVNDITYKYYKSTDSAYVTLYIEGTGDYTRKGYEAPPWSGFIEFDSAVVNITGITSTKNMFSNCPRLKKVDLSGLDTSQVTDMSGMFAVGGEKIVHDEGYMFALGNLEELDLSMLDTSKVTNMSRMFSYCGGLRRLNISGWDTSRVTDMSRMFEYCMDLGLTSDDLANLNTSNVTNMDSMFKYYAYNRTHLAAVETLDLGSFNTAKVRNMYGMFEHCSYIHNLNVSSFDTRNVINMSRMFYDCVNIEKMDISGFDTSKVTDMSEMFYRCSAQDVRNFDTSNVTDMSGMFQGCGVSSRDTIAVSHFDTSKVTDMSSMFKNASGYMKTLDVSNFDTSNVTDMSGMFAGLANLQSLDVSGFDTSNVKYMGHYYDSRQGMFEDCSSLKSLDLSGFDIGNVTDMSGMFKNCSSLKSLDVSGFETVNVNFMTDMFSNCAALEGLDLSSFDMSNIGNTDGSGGNSVSFITGCSALSYICTPRNCALNVSLPDGKWYSEDAEEYTSLPTALSESIILYKGGYPEDDKGETKQLLFISGITLTNKVYDAEPVSYTGTAVVTDTKGNKISDAVLLPSYSGILTDGSAYETTAKAPVQAGSYTLSFDVSGIDESKYIINKTSYNFHIVRKTVTITAPSIEVEIGGTVPGLNGLTCKVNGVLENDNAALAVQPSLKYSQDAASIPVNIAGSYDIIPYGAEFGGAAAGNYSIRYVRGKLKIGQPSEDDELVVSGTTFSVTWKITEAGKLILEGDGEYTKTNRIDNEITPPWCEDKWRNKILSAEVRISGITRLQYMFVGLKNLKTVDLSGLDTGSVKYMHHMFDGCSSLRSLDLTGLNTSSVTSMHGMFQGCSSLESLDLSGFDTSKVIYMGYYYESGQGMFENCSSLTSLDLSSFNTGNVTDMSGMFENCSSLKSLDLSSFDTAKVERMGYSIAFKDIRGMFSGCSSLESLDLSNFNTASVKDMSSAFSGCSSLKNLNVSSFNTANVECMHHMFDGCSSLESLDLSSFNTEKAFSMNGMFSGCSSLENINLSSFNTAYTVDMGSMFADCTALKNLDLSGFSSDSLEYMSEMFENCTSLTTLDLSSFNNFIFDGTIILFPYRNMDRMFSGCTSLVDLNLSGFNTDYVCYMSEMFRGCSSLQSLDLSSFGRRYAEKEENAREPNRMDGMFYGCTSLRTINLKGFNTDIVEDMSGMFSGCSALTDLDLSGFDTESVSNMSGMFSGCSTLTGLDLRNFDMSGVTGESGSNMFADCTALSYLFTPKNCKTVVGLPVSENTDRWTSQDGTVYTELPKEQMDSILIYKNGYLENPSGGLKQILSIGGIGVNSKVYDSTPASYSGVALVTDDDGQPVSGMTLNYSYSGTLADGTPYTDTVQAPSQAGSYVLTVSVAGALADQYVIVHGNLHHFNINPREVTITASALVIEIGEELPVFTDLQYTVEGLLGSDGLSVKPSFRYSPEPDAVPVQGSYQIIPYGADAGNNYRIRYVNGILLVGDVGEVRPDDIPADGKIPEGLWIAGVSEKGYDYTGKTIKPEVRVYDHKVMLREKTDYTIAYARNTKVYAYDSGNQAFDAKKAPTITVTGKGNYTGRETQTFKILPLDIGISEKTSDGNGFASDDMTIAYSGKSQKPLPVLWWNDKKLKNKTDYTIAYYGDKDGRQVDSVKEAGQYWIEFTGKGNFTGKRRVSLTVTDSLKLMSKMTVAKIPNQPYTGSAVMPKLTVKDGKTVLTENVDYTVSYSRNTAIGTAYAVITGVPSGTKGYSGTKRVSFKITGTPMSKVTVTGLGDKKFVYEGTDLKPEIKLTVKIKTNGIEEERILIPDTDYTTVWQKNRNAGTATVVFTGKGSYTGTLKKTFKIGKYDIGANTGSRFAAELIQQSIPYAKGGAKPEVTVTFRAADGSVQMLTEGQDYTMSYRNHTAVNDGSNQDKQPVVTVKGKGNYSGTYGTAFTYKVTTQDIGKLTLTAADKTYQNKKNSYATKVAVTDLNGKVLKAGTDYNKTFDYTYKYETTVKSGTAADSDMIIRAAGESVDREDVIPAGTVLCVKVTAREGSNYTGAKTGEYRVTQAAISSASVSVEKKDYTGQPVMLTKPDITVKIKGKELAEDQWEIVPDSYKNNVKKGTASVTIRGVNNYGGTKTVKFTIRAKGFLWWWRK